MYLFFLVSLNLCGYPNVEILYTSRKSNTFPIHAPQMELKFVWPRWSSTWTCMFAARKLENGKKNSDTQLAGLNHLLPFMATPITNSLTIITSLANSLDGFSGWIYVCTFCVTTVSCARPRIRCRLKFSQSYWHIILAVVSALVSKWLSEERFSLS